MLAFRNSISFSQNIEKTANEMELSLIETLLWQIEQDDLEIESISKLLTSDLKSKIEIEAGRLSLIKGVAGETLPL